MWWRVGMGRECRVCTHPLTVISSSVFIYPLTEVREFTDGPPSSVHGSPKLMHSSFGQNSDRKNYSLKKSNDCDQYHEANSRQFYFFSLFENSKGNWWRHDWWLGFGSGFNKLVSAKEKVEALSFWSQDHKKNKERDYFMLYILSKMMRQLQHFQTHYFLRSSSRVPAPEFFISVSMCLSSCCFPHLLLLS